MSPLCMVVVGASLLALGCGGAGPYGHAPNYVPLGAEEEATHGATEFDPVMVQREPEVWRSKRVVMFGIVTQRAPGPSGHAYLSLSLRRLEPRNLCENKNDSDTCRVTVSDREFGSLHALVHLTPEDDVGEHSVGAGSLVRLSGQMAQDVDPNDGQVVVRAGYYRHWPRHFYATKANAETMRQ